jgi:hypothetical protein
MATWSTGVGPRVLVSRQSSNLYRTGRQRRKQLIALLSAISASTDCHRARKGNRVQ